MNGRKSFWVICENQEEGARWIAFPATEETLEEVKKLAGIFGGNVFVAEEV